VWRNSAPLLLEARRTGDMKLVDPEDDTEEVFGVRGYAAIVEQPYPVAGGKESGWGWDETLAASAFTRALEEGDDVRFLLNHEGVPMARTRSGTLSLWVDNIGLGMEANGLDTENPDVIRLRSAVRRSDLDQMSYAFRATRQEWNEDYTERRILEVRLYDVAAVTYPANDATVIGERQAKPAPTTRGMTLALARAIADGARANRIPA
jgi:HK97 family phage prohead protease